MVISREINGEVVSITLSASEKMECAMEYEHECDIEDVLLIKDLQFIFSEEVEKAFQESLSDIAYTERQYRDKYDMSYEIAAHDAILDWIIEHDFNYNYN